MERCKGEKRRCKRLDYAGRIQGNNRKGVFLMTIGTMKNGEYNQLGGHRPHWKRAYKR